LLNACLFFEERRKGNTSFYPKTYDRLLRAMRLGHGGQTCISKIFGCDRKTIRKGIQELENHNLLHFFYNSLIVQNFFSEFPLQGLHLTIG
jgi:hypothetical protein